MGQWDAGTHMDHIGTMGHKRALRRPCGTYGCCEEMGHIWALLVFQGPGGSHWGALWA